MIPHPPLIMKAERLKSMYTTFVYNSNWSHPPVAPVARSVVAVVIGAKQRGVRYQIDTSPP